ncbi:phytoene/squalene synthase family protein [Corynebacterium halotolerans]|uniref:Putative phytoene synthase n=1 Tax=Corynebacterium halotolerans YIM 70093 = DSM 44683 TaxID=1121362 RepID=M1MVG0_9CORY|nr:phytoene/squalene synthase family protein [Corynebacterium halotolerans]AGF71714.1 putative phytoene synthase [Corynebacterium halotolerans YIM 70093 = DSM 44683]
MPEHEPQGRELLGEFLDRYDRTAVRAAHQVILSYSTSFTLATRLLEKRVRTDIRNLYAMVRIADEIVDGTTEAAGVPHEEVAALLDDYERAVLDAPRHRFHVDPVLHAYALTARRCRFNPEHVVAFFSSMRRDLHQATHDGRSFNDYVYGSAEVIGLLCLSAFLVDHPVTDDERARLESGARSLGAAFQKINFLRDLAEDSGTLGRTYFPGLAENGLTEEHKADLIADIRIDLADARAVIPLLPVTARTGVLAATGLFAELTDRIEALPAAELTRRRVSVPRRTKTAILARALTSAPRLNRRTNRRKGTRP